MASGDLWAGAEVMIGVTAEALLNRPECELHAIILNPGTLHDRLRSLGIPVQVFPESKLGVFGLFQAITQALREARCDILHTHRYKENILGTLAAAYAGVPVSIRTIHGSPEPFRGLAHARMVFYVLLDRMVQRYLNDRVVLVAHALKSEGGSWSRQHKVAVIHNALPDVEPRTTCKATPRDRFVIGWLGRMVEAKSLDVLLRAIAHLRTRLPSITVRLAGDGPETPKLRNLAVSLGIDDLVEFCGFVGDTQDFFSTLDVFVLPSRQEGIPVSLLEALRAEVPVVASSVGGIPEVVINRRNGLLVPPDDIEALAAALDEIATDARLRSDLRAEGRATVSSQFSVRRLAADLISLYSDTLLSKQRPTHTSVACPQ